MAIPNSTYTQILSSSLENRSGVIADAICKRNALYKYMRKGGNLKRIAGGESIVRPIEYAENGTYTRYTAAGFINITPQTILTSCRYPWKQIAMSIQQNGLEDIQNAGKEQIVDLLATKQKNCEKSFINNFSGDLYSAGEEDDGLQIGGLQYVVADAPSASASVGGINQSLHTFWQNASYTLTTAAGFPGAVVDASNVRKIVELAYLKGLRDGLNYNLAVSDNTFWTAYTEALRAIQRIGPDEMIKDGILTLKVYGMDYIYDGGADGQCPTGRMYMLDTDSLYLVVSSKRDFKALPGNRQPINQDVEIKIMAWAGNLVCTNRRAQAVIINA